MRIAVVNQHREEALGGSEIQCDLVARGLAARGHDICYVAPLRGDRRPIETPYRVVQVRRDSVAIVEAIAEFSPDIVYWRFNKNHFRSVANALKRRGLPVVFAVSHIADVRPWEWNRSIPGYYSKLKRLVHHRWQHGGFRFVDALTSLNEKYLGIAPVKNQYYVPNAMTSEVIPFCWPRPYCAWIANIKPSKRPEIAVKLAAVLKPLGVDVLLIGKLTSREYAWLEDPGKLPDNCFYLGPKKVEEVNGILAASVLHLHTCWPEGFGNVFIQAWLQGRPSVSLEFDPGGYLNAERIGKVAGNDFERFAQYVRFLIERPEYRQELGHRARSFANRTFSVDSLGERVEHVLQATLAVNWSKPASQAAGADSRRETRA